MYANSFVWPCKEIIYTIYTIFLAKNLVRPIEINAFGSFWVVLYIAYNSYIALKFSDVLKIFGRLSAYKNFKLRTYIITHDGANQ